MSICGETVLSPPRKNGGIVYLAPAARFFAREDAC